MTLRDNWCKIWNDTLLFPLTTGQDKIWVTKPNLLLRAFIIVLPVMRVAMHLDISGKGKSLPSSKSSCG